VDPDSRPRTHKVKVSVIIPAFRCVGTIDRAVRSALAQPEVEQVILVEDGSADGTLEACRRLAANDQRVVLTQHPDTGNHGAGASRDLGIRRATELYVAFLDADDYYAEGRFTTDGEVFGTHPDADGVYGAVLAQFEDDEARAVFLHRFHNPLTTVWKVCAPEDLFIGLTMTPWFGGFHLNALTVKRAAFELFQPWFREDLRLHQDTDFIFRLAHIARLYPGSLEQPVAYRTVHNNNRITAGHDLHASRAELYRHLAQWSSTQTGLASVHEQFMERYFLNALPAAGSKGTTWKVVREVIARPSVLQSHYVREQMVHALLGKGSWLGGKLIVLSWHFSGGLGNC